jgi:hypothetical protein
MSHRPTVTATIDAGVPGPGAYRATAIARKAFSTVEKTGRQSSDTVTPGPEEAEDGLMRPSTVTATIDHLSMCF